MAYQVLARKYRPQRFADVQGQGHVTVTLMNALTQGRVAHGYIFSGHRGIGKTTIARILAMALNCRNAIGSEPRPTAEPCEVCESCTEIRAGNAVDVIEIDAATNRGIDEIRELRDAARYRPARDRYKIYILDEAHQITDAAFNALLKTLEEPPDHVVFMMATTQPEDIPQTVRSRCQHYSFHAIKMADILTELRGIAEREGVEADDAALNLLAEAGDGSMRDALSVMDQAIASAPFADGHPVLSGAQIRELMGTVSNAMFERLMEAVDGGRSAEVITLANELMDAGNSPSQLARQCVKYLRNVLMAKVAGVPMSAGAETDGAGAEILQISPEERRRAARTAALFTEEELTRYLGVMLRTFDELGYRQEPRLHFELGLLKLVHLRRLLPVEELLSRLPAARAVPTAQSGGGGGVAGGSAGERGVPKGVATGRPAGAPAAAPAQSRSSTLSFSPFSADTQRKRFASEPEPRAEAARVAEVALRVDADSGVVDGGDGSLLPGGAAAAVVAPVEVARTPEPLLRAEPVSAAPVQGDELAGRLRDAAVAALEAAKGQTSAAEGLADAEWTMVDGVLRVSTGFSKAMLGMVMNAEADRIAKAAIRDETAKAGVAGIRVEWLPGAPQEKKTGAPKRAGRSGTAQARAQEHPMVKQAQELFGAEIRNVIDLSGGK